MRGAFAVFLLSRWASGVSSHVSAPPAEVGLNVGSDSSDYVCPGESVDEASQIRLAPLAQSPAGLGGKGVVEV